MVVFPEGAKGLGKPWRSRYRLERFGRGGFVEVALRTGAPIVPCAVVGSEEVHPKLAELPVVARLLRAPYVPITPTFPLLGPLGPCRCPRAGASRSARRSTSAATGRATRTTRRSCSS